MGSATKDAQNVLDMMQAGIMGRKANAAAKLTPVKGEVTPSHKVVATPEAPLAGPAPAVFPYDNPDMVRAALVEARRQLDFVLKGLDALDAAYGVGLDTAAKPVSLDAVRQEKERAADAAAAEREAVEERAAIQAVEAEELRELADHDPEDFAERMARLQTEAQEATFAKQGGWACPNHSTFEVRTTKKGREYRVCPTCDEFERL